MRILIVSGTFDENGGKPSGLVSLLHQQIVLDENVQCDFYNGGNYKELPAILEKEVPDVDVVMWFANVPNELAKVRDVKSINPRVILVSSKRNNNEYTFMELVNKALQYKCNLMLEFNSSERPYRMRILDPLGNEWASGTDPVAITASLLKLCRYLKTITRQGTTYVNKVVPVPDEREFFDYVKSTAEVFHNLIMPAEGVGRFLGNCSFRCIHGGFPSFKCDEIVYVSRRNVDKRQLGQDAFVPTQLYVDKVLYYNNGTGEHKPSVDTPVQLRLFQFYHNVKYIVHSHTYVVGTGFTEDFVPCGGLQEVEQVLKTIPFQDATDFAVNLKGHGCLLLTSSVAALREFQFEGRRFPEVQPVIPSRPLFVRE